MARPKPWRVRVIRRIEDSVEVFAYDDEQAYDEASKLPGVVSVIPKSAMPADKLAGAEPPAGVSEE
jgi:hypothetical protein